MAARHPDARVVLSPEEFDAVQKDEIVVCRMTSPAWVVLFTKIAGLVTDAGGMASHPAVVSREFGFPAVVGPSDATRRIRTGDRVRVNGSLGLLDMTPYGRGEAWEDKPEGWPEGRHACWYWRSDADGNATWGPTSRPVPQWTRPGATPVETLGRHGHHH